MRNMWTNSNWKFIYIPCVILYSINNNKIGIRRYILEITIIVPQLYGVTIRLYTYSGRVSIVTTAVAIDAEWLTEDAW